jgi:hypothetical protein
MHFVLITAGQGDHPSVQHLHHHAPGHHGQARLVDLLVLDSRHMSPACLQAATRAVGEVRARHGLRHGVLLSGKPAVPVIVAAIRCGLRDIITQYVGAAHLRQILRTAMPSLSRREFRDIVGLLRALGGEASAESAAAVPLARRAAELSRRAEELDEKTRALAAEKERLTRLDQDLRERTRRLDRQIARLQNDSDVVSSATNHPFAGSTPSVPDLAARTRSLDQRAAELDLREKMLNEMQALLLASPQAPAPAGRPRAAA